MKAHPLTADNLEQACVAIELPLQVVTLLQKEAQKSGQSVAQFLMEHLEDQADAREANKRLKDLQSKKSKAVPWADVRTELLSAP